MIDNQKQTHILTSLFWISNPLPQGREALSMEEEREKRKGRPGRNKKRSLRRGGLFKPSPGGYIPKRDS